MEQNKQEPKKKAGRPPRYGKAVKSYSVAMTPEQMARLESHFAGRFETVSAWLQHGMVWKEQSLSIDSM